jgi:hypothetical protein
MTKRAPYSQTVYVIRHKETGLMATQVYHSSEGWEFEYSFGNRIPCLFSDRSKLPDINDYYEIVELDLIEVQERPL